MQIKMLWAVFASVFLAELGDKTQLATMVFASNPEMSKTGVFLAASAALISATCLAVLVGSQLSRIIPTQYLKIGAGIVFILIGIWVLWESLKA